MCISLNPKQNWMWGFKLRVTSYFFFIAESSLSPIRMSWNWVFIEFKGWSYTFRIGKGLICVNNANKNKKKNPTFAVCILPHKIKYTNKRRILYAYPSIRFCACLSTLGQPEAAAYPSCHRLTCSMVKSSGSIPFAICHLQSATP